MRITAVAAIMILLTIAHTRMNLGGWAGAQTVSPQEVQYELIDLGTLGGVQSEARAVNAAGQVVGWAENANGEQRAFLWQEGTMTDLGTLGGPQSEARAISAAGRVAGWARKANGHSRAFLWEDGAMLDLGTLGGAASRALGINDNGQVVGEAQNADGHSRAFLWQEGIMTDLGTLGGMASSAFGINNAGQVVGTAQNANGHYRAFLWQDGAMLDLGTLGGTESLALEINDIGQVVGWAYHADFRFTAFLWQDGAMLDLGTLGGDSSSAPGINNAGQVVGTAENTEGDFRAFLWQDGAMLDLGTLGGRESWAFDINDVGQVAGRVQDVESKFRAVLWHPSDIAVHVFHWVGPEEGGPDGAFSVADHWQAVDNPEVKRVPGPNDIAVFNLVVDSGYVVTLDQNQEVGAVWIEQGMLMLQSVEGAVLRLSPNEGEPALRVGTTPGVRGGLDLPSGLLIANGDVIVGDGPDTNGLLTLRETARMEVSTQGTFTVGRQGKGQVYVLGSVLHVQAQDRDAETGLGSEPSISEVQANGSRTLAASADMHIGDDSAAGVSVAEGGFLGIFGNLHVDAGAPEELRVPGGVKVSVIGHELGAGTKKALAGQGAKLSVDGDVSIGSEAPATLRLIDATVEANGYVDVGPQGRVEGTGTLKPGEGFRLNVAGGYIVPGISSGTLIIDGDLNQIDGVIEIKIAGLEEDQFDRLVVTGDAALSGTLEILFIDGFAPQEDNVFKFLQIGRSFIDNGLTIAFPNLLPGFEYETCFSNGAFGLIALNIGTVAPAEPCYDFGETGVVDVADIQTAAQHWRKQSTDPDWEWDNVQQYDVDGDAVITILDIMTVSAHWGQTC